MTTIAALIRTFSQAGALPVLATHRGRNLDFINLGDGVWLFVLDIGVMLVLAAVLLTASRFFLGDPR